MDAGAKWSGWPWRSARRKCGEAGRQVSAKAAYLPALRSKGNPTAREAAVAELLRDAGFYVYSA